MPAATSCCNTWLNVADALFDELTEYAVAGFGSRRNVTSRHVPPGNVAVSKRGMRVGSWPCHHEVSEATSSESLFASWAKVSGTSEGSTTIACTCGPVTTSGRSTD